MNEITIVGSYIDQMLLGNFIDTKHPLDFTSHKRSLDFGNRVLHNNTTFQNNNQMTFTNKLNWENG